MSLLHETIQSGRDTHSSVLLRALGCNNNLVTAPTFMDPVRYRDPAHAVEVATRLRQNAITQGNAFQRAGERNPLSYDPRPIFWCSLSPEIPKKKGPKQPPRESFAKSVMPYLDALTPCMIYRIHPDIGTYSGKLYDGSSSPIIHGGVYVMSGAGESDILYLTNVAVPLFAELMQRGYYWLSNASEYRQKVIGHYLETLEKQNPGHPVIRESDRRNRLILLPGTNLSDVFATEGLRLRPKDGPKNDVEGVIFTTSQEFARRGGDTHNGLLSMGHHNGGYHIEHFPTDPRLDDFLKLMTKQGYVSSAQLPHLFESPETLDYIREKLFPRWTYIKKIKLGEHDFLYYVGSRPDVALEKFTAEVGISLRKSTERIPLAGDRILSILSPTDMLTLSNRGVAGILPPKKKGGEAKSYPQQIEWKILTPTQYALLAYMVMKKGVVSFNEFESSFPKFCDERNIPIEQPTRAMELLKRKGSDRAIGYGFPVQIRMHSGLMYLTGMPNPKVHLEKVQHTILRKAMHAKDGAYMELGGAPRRIQVLFDPEEEAKQFMFVQGERGESTIFPVSVREWEFLRIMNRQGMITGSQIRQLYGPNLTNGLYFSFERKTGQLNGGILYKLSGAGLVLRQGYPDHYALVPYSSSEDNPSRITHARGATTERLIQGEMTTFMSDGILCDDTDFRRRVSEMGIWEDSRFTKLHGYLEYYVSSVQPRGRHVSQEVLANALTTLIVGQLIRQQQFVTADLAGYLVSEAKSIVQGGIGSVSQTVHNLALKAISYARYDTKETEWREVTFSDLAPVDNGPTSDPLDYVGGRDEGGYRDVELSVTLNSLFPERDSRLFVDLLLTGYDREEAIEMAGISSQQLCEIEKRLLATL